MTPVRDLLRRLDDWLHEPAPHERLAILRVLIGGFVTVYLVVNAGEFNRVTRRDPAEFDPVGVARVLSGPLPDTVVWGLFVGLLFAGVVFTAGVWFRLVGPLFAIGVLAWASYHSSWGRLLHFEHLFTLHVLVLGFAPAGRVTEPGPAAIRYGWPVRLMAIATVTTYFLTGLAKLRMTGLDWFGRDVLADHIAYSTIRVESIGGPTPPLSDWVLDRTWLIPPMAAAALAVELLAPLALVLRRFRVAWAIAAIGFHAGTGLLMWVFFGYRGLGFGLLPLFAVERGVAGLRHATRTLRPTAKPPGDPGDAGRPGRRRRGSGTRLDLAG